MCEQRICSKPVEVSGLLALQTGCKFGELSVLTVTLNLNQSALASWSTTSPL